MSDPIMESLFVGLNDDELMDQIGGMFEKIKRLEEAKKNDSELIQMKEEMDELAQRRYLKDRDLLKARLKAARRHARTRNIEVDI